MSNYTQKSKEPFVIATVRLEQRAINEALEIHNNFSEFVRDALDEKIIREQKKLEVLRS